MVDRRTRWLEAVPLKDIEVVRCADAFIAAWVMRFGVQSLLTSDQGRQFISSLWACLCEQLSVQRQLTTAYHMQANGMVERVHQQLKDTLRARLAGALWAHHLPGVLLGLRAAPKKPFGLSPAELLYGEPLTLPGQFISTQEPDIRSSCDSCIRCNPSPPARFPPHLKSSLPRPCSPRSLCI
jgi:hypothetical protein